MSKPSNQLIVANVVALSLRVMGSHTPNLNQLVQQHSLRRIRPMVPAMTCSTQSTYLTGKPPREHGIVGNGWYFDDTGEIRFWLQHDKLVQSPRIWDVATQRGMKLRVANICWWYAMHAGCDVTVTPRPMYPADGRKLPDCWTHPPTLRDTLQQQLGQFPLFKFWGPMTSIESTAWIVSAADYVVKHHDPDLTLVYLPHLDYDLQRFGPDHEKSKHSAAEVDEQVGRLVKLARDTGRELVVLSEYGIVPVNQPVHPNRILRQHGLIAIRQELGREYLDAGASDAFAVADHQVAHVHVKDKSRIEEIAELLNVKGVARVVRRHEFVELGMDHARSGDLILLADENAWFTYYFWLDDSKAPDYARTVDIHRKPGYDPCELFIDPAITLPKLKVARKLLARKLGFRNLLDITPLDATLVKGSHGVVPRSQDDWPVWIGKTSNRDVGPAIEPTGVMQEILSLC
jgi:predicted AlkP superfamily pyrophosphatase or phosphodiesterase